MSNETTVDGVVTDLPQEALEDLKPAEAPKEPEPKVEEPKPAEGEPADDKPKEEPKKEEAPKEPEPETKIPEGTSRSKPKPIAKLLEKAHSAEERASKAEAENAELKKQLEGLSTKPASEAAPDIAALAKKHNLDEAFLNELVTLIKPGEAKPAELPQEITAIIAEHKAAKEQAAEIAAFDNRVGKLTATFKDEPIAEHRDKLLELAYSTEKAPDGEPYYQKELSELYFAYIKPQVEAGRKTAEPSKGGTQTTQALIDFEEIFERDNPADIEAMDEATFKKYQVWLDEKAEKDSQVQKGKTLY